ncbi:MAG: type I-C CRISPR-associated protein Cas7/Csd2 [Actinobacteria bacterium]|nr:type I-C CRISPR-associated protein Cas7/Csd2 [Actinomycetota bacterium]
MENNKKIDKRYDFVLFFDVQDGNPNGDPDAGNLPRIDAETGMGLVTDVCLKRKVRNYVQLTKVKDDKPEDGYDIFIKEKAVLNTLIDDTYKKLDINLSEKPKDEKDGKKRNKEGAAQGNEITKGREKMCADFYDVRTFGAVMSTGANAGQVRGPVQMTFSRSVEPVVALEHSITRVAKTTEERAETGGSEMGRKFTIPYGLYRTHGFISAHLAAQTGFSKDDLDLFWKALKEMFEHDHSAARGLMSTRNIIVFEHNTPLGNKPAYELFEKISLKRTTQGSARQFSDYEILLDGKKLDENFKTVSVS